MKKILITGSSGFIGFHLATSLSESNIVLGIDNHNSYYSKKIKDKRLSILKNKKNFSYKKLNLKNEKILQKIFERFKPDTVYHIAGQPGVLYSFKNPKSYKINNTHVTKIICKVCKKNKINNFIFASSSSVYGDQKKFPIKENNTLRPVNYYAKTKLRSEEIIYRTFSHTKINFIIFRFFTVYGPFGRPDMFIHKLLNAIKLNKTIKVHNRGLNFRDFTYIEDVIKILKICLKKKLNKQIINICRSKPIRTDKIINLILKFLKQKNVKLKMTKFVKGEMLKTHGSNLKLQKYIGKFKFTNLNIGLKKTVEYYKKYGC